jgi:glycosyltransferase involved in cell wall biosynthesis
LIILKPGATHSFADQLDHLAECLSPRFDGVVLTFGSFSGRKQVGRFRLECLPMPQPASLLDKIRYARTTFSTIGAEIRAAKTPVVVLAYDPLFSGLIGLAARLRFGVPLVCELNNNFASPHNWTEIPGRFRRAFKRTFALAVASTVLHGCDAIRLMFPRQLEGFYFCGTLKNTILGFDTVPLDRFPPKHSHRYVLAVGYPFRLKGIDVLLRAFARVRDKHPDWRLVVIGHDLKRFAEPRFFDLERVEIRPAVPNVELAPWISEAGIVALASRSEGIPRILLESGAAAKPRVSSDVGGVRRVVEDGVDGLVVPAGDEKALASALDTLMGSADMRERLGAAARRRVLSEFGAAEYREVIQRLVATALVGGANAVDRA